MEKVIYFDMDGTIANLYGVENWLGELRSYNPRPYAEAEPMWNMARLGLILEAMKLSGWTIGVITWLSKDSTAEYDRAVRAAKREWLREYGLLHIMDEIHMVKYGTPKHTTANLRHGVLVDDNQAVREAWENYGGDTIDPTTTDLLDYLENLWETMD